jgi:REP element-mobilizing transposase RayT
MKHDIHTHRRKSIRLKEYDYSLPGEYFITICTHGKQCIFGEVVDEKMHLNEVGKIAKEEWLKTPDIRPAIELDVFEIMPNHLHGIIVIKDESSIPKVGTHNCASLQRKPRSLGSIIAGFKSAVTTRINNTRNTPYVPVWQGKFHDHIIRNEKELNNIREYIMNNPLNWWFDEENPYGKNKINDSPD